MFSEKLVPIYQTVRCYKPENLNMNFEHRENNRETNNIYGILVAFQEMLLL
jgi:hypothetical protein